MAEISKELMDKLMKAGNQEEAAALLKAEGQDDAAVETVWEQIQTLRAQDGQELSLDELEDVAGGLDYRDWWRDGCAATVEEGSDCWGTDGGCRMSNIKYSGLPEVTCPKCDRYSAKRPQNCLGTWIVKCKYCGELSMSIEELQAHGLW